MTKKRTLARKNCANWNVGKCLGCVFIRENGELHMKIDKKLANKDCVVEDGCDYFENVVMKGKLCI